MYNLIEEKYIYEREIQIQHKISVNMNQWWICWSFTRISWRAYLSGWLPFGRHWRLSGPTEGAVWGTLPLRVDFYFDSLMSSTRTRFFTYCVVAVWRYVESSNVGGGWEGASLGRGAGEPGGGTAAQGNCSPGSSPQERRCCHSTLGLRKSGAAAARLVM